MTERERLSRRALLGRGAAAALALAGGAPLLAGCGGPGGPLGGSGAAPSAGRTARTEVAIAQGPDITTLDVTWQSEGPTAAVLFHIYDPVLRRDKDMKLVLGLAESYRNVDEVTWEFKLRKGVTFHNGEPLTAEAIRYTVARTADPKYKSRGFTRVSAIKEVKVIDDLTAHIITKAPFAPLPATMPDLALVPPRYIAEKGDDNFFKNPVGCGPYKFVEWRKDERVVLEAYDNYWQGKPVMRRVTFRPIPEAAARMAALSTGQVDVVTNVPPDQVKQLDQGDTSVRKVTSAREVYGAVNTFVKPFSDKRVRQAMQYAVDVDAIIKDVLLGFAQRLATQAKPADVGFDPSIKPLPYDPEKAKALLKEAGYGDGLEITYNTPAGRFLKDKEVAEAVAGHLAKVGIKARVIAEDFTLFLQQYDAKKFQGLYQSSWGNSTFDLDYTLFPLLDSKGRGYYYKHPEADKWIDQARTVFPRAEREKAYSEALKFLQDDAPWSFQYLQEDLYGVRNWLEWQPRSDELILAWDMKPR